MGYTVMIAEKPSAGRDYAKYLKINDKHDGYISGFSPVVNREMIVTWAVGHLVALSYPEKYEEKYKKWKLEDLPFLPKNYQYELIKSVSKQFKIIKSLYAEAEAIWYAGDAGREGLYIQSLIRRMAGVPEGIEEKVVWLSSLTEKEVLRGIKEAKPYEEYKLRFASGYARAAEDYATGINFSRALTCKYGQDFNKRASEGEFLTISVGRVMSTVLGMVVKREREIREFKEETFYKIIATSSFDAEWHVTPESLYYNSISLYNDCGFKDKEHAENFRSTCEKNPVLTVKEKEVKEEKKGAPLLFNLAELQLFCSKKYKISPDQTLKVAQTLYEGKFITYPRTDSRYLSSAVAGEIKYNLNGLTHGSYKNEFIEEIKESGSYKRISSSPYVNDEKVTDHFAIIPTGKYNEIEKLKEIEQNILYDIIDRFLCIFFSPAVYEKGEITLHNNVSEEFKGTCKTVKEMGWTKVLDEHEEPSENPFKALNIGDEIFANYSVKEGKTTPPKRFSTGTLIITMENAGKLIEDEELRAQIKGCGIGTSATRAAIIKKLIYDKKYLNCNKNQILTPTYAGECVVDILEQTIPTLLSPEMTASWEKGLAEIEDGTVSYNDFMAKMNDYVRAEVEKIKTSDEITYSGEEPKELHCPICLTGLMKENQKGWCCSNYKDGSCNFTIWKTIAGRKISRENITHLIENGESHYIKGFHKKDGSTFDAILHINKEEKKVEFTFPVRKKKEEIN